MDHGGLIRGVLFVFIGFLTGCVTHQEASVPLRKASALESSLPPNRLLILSEHFMEWQKGYGLQVRDHDRGLLVTEWIQDSPAERFRYTLRVSKDVEGSYLTLHLVRESFEENSWRDLGSDGSMEAHLIGEMKTYLATKESP